MDYTHDELAELMEDPPGSMAAGFAPPRRASNDPDREGQYVPMDVASWQAADFMQTKGAGWTIVHRKKAKAAGMTTDGVNQHALLHPDEYVDEEALQKRIQDALGVTYEQLRAVYGRKGGGPCPRSLRPTRDRLDDALAGIAAKGGNLALLARHVGVPPLQLQRAARRGLTDACLHDQGRDGCAASMPSRDGRGSTPASPPLLHSPRSDAAGLIDRTQTHRTAAVRPGPAARRGPLRERQAAVNRHRVVPSGAARRNDA
jgi:hypothetical protein